MIADTARVLKPGGLYLYDTINRTRQSQLVMIKLSQEWAPTAWMPRDLHDWNQFITPGELRDTLRRHRLLEQDVIGMAPKLSAAAMLRKLRQLKRHRLTCAEFGRSTAFERTADLRISYIGHAIKDQ